MPRTRQLLCHLLVVCAIGSGNCNHDSVTSFDSSWRPFFLLVARVWWFIVVWPQNYFYFLSFFSFSFFLELWVDHAKIHISHSIYFFFWFSLSSHIFQLFYLHWLFLIGFYFLFHPWSFDFFNLFSNLVLIFLIFICFVLNHFLDWFVYFQFHP